MNEHELIEAQCRELEELFSFWNEEHPLGEPPFVESATGVDRVNIQIIRPESGIGNQ